MLLATALFLPVAGHGQFRKYFKNSTCRIDYYHSGSEEVEYYLEDLILEEPTWYGSRTNLVDTFDFGNYKFEVYDILTGKLLYSRGYSSLFLEYRSTEDARSQCGSFPESVVFPFPRKPVRVDFLSRGKDLVWQKQHEIIIDPDDPSIKKIKRKDLSFETLKIHRSGRPKKRLDIVFLPEGYTADQKEKFEADCRAAADDLLGCTPYDSSKDKINIHAVWAPSEEEGTDLPGDSVWKNTLLHTNFYTFGSERYLTTASYHDVRNVAAHAPNDQIVILVNHPKYGGGGIYNFYSVATTGDEQAPFLLVHEFGHAFAGLGDEYYTSDVAVQDFYDLSTEPWEPNLTSLVEFDRKWKDVLPSGTPVPTPDSSAFLEKVGVYEGGGYMTKGLYRPYIDCTMNVVRYNHFCPVCQRAIQRMIDFYAE